MYDFIKVDVEALTEDACIAFEDVTGESLYAGDERRILLHTCAGVVAQLAMYANVLMNQNFRQYASGKYLDILGADIREPRLEAQAALVTLEYTLSAAMATDITIPAGTRATPNGTVFFATVEALVIPAGETIGTVIAQATVAGLDGNGYPPGTITAQVDLLPYVAAVTNTDTSQGGTNLESDDDYRTRLMLSEAKYSTAGPVEAYQYWALTADASIAAVAVDEPAPGEVDVIVLGAGGVIPSQPILDKVAAALNDKTIRPLTDMVNVLAAEAVNYDITVSYSIATKDAGKVQQIQAAVEVAVQAFADAQQTRLGGAINPDTLKRDILNAGAYAATVSEPAYTTLTAGQVAIANLPASITYEGLL